MPKEILRRCKFTLILASLIMASLLALSCADRQSPPSSEPASAVSKSTDATRPAPASQDAAASESDQVDVVARPGKSQDNDIQFERISLEQGLSQSVVLCILQDSKGFMWFGTQDGLNRYDGYEFVVYKHDPEDPDTLSHNFVWSIHEDRAGMLWIGTNGSGLDKFDRDTGRFTHYQNDPKDPHSLSDNIVSSIYEDGEGVLWIGTADGGLERFDRETEQFIHHQNDPEDPHSLGDNSVQVIYEDREGVLWIGTNDGGLDRFDRETGQFVHYENDPDDPRSLRDNDVQAIHQDQQGVLWIGTNDGGLEQLDRQTGEFTHYQHDPEDPHSLSHDAVQFIYQDREGVLWIGTNGGGLERLDRATGQFTHHRHDPHDPHSLSSSQVWSIYEDLEGVLWVGTFGGGLGKFDRQRDKFTHYQAEPNKPNSLSSNIIWSIYEDQKGILWIGTAGGGLNRFDRGAGQYIHYHNIPTDTHSLSDNQVWSIHPNQEGGLWIGTSGGLDEFDLDTEQFTHYPTYPVFSILTDREGVLWLGTWGGGLARFDRETKQFTFHTNDATDAHSLSDNSVVSICEDREGVLWVGTFSGGLNRFDVEAERFVRYQNDPNDPQSLSHNTVLSVHVDRQDMLWIGTGGGGLNRFDRETETFVHYTEKDGLPNDYVYGILENDASLDSGERSLWLSTNRGLSEFNIQTETFRNYDTGDGLQSNEFDQGAYHKSRSGEMFFGGVNGFNAFYPEQIKDNPYIPPILLTSLTQGGEEMGDGTTVGSEVTFKWPNNFFEFEFAALSYAQPEKNQYAYMLEGFDPDWIESGTRRFGRYTNLPGGTYILRMKGSNNDGVWNEEGFPLKITVVPPIWQMWWFRGTVALVLLGGAIGAYWLRVRSVEARSRALEIQVADRTKELAALNAVAAVVSRSLDLREILRDALEKTLQVTGIEAGGVYLLNEEAGVLTIATHRGFDPEFVDEINGLQVGEGFSGQVVQSGHPLVVSDISADQRLSRTAVREEGFHSLVSLPLTSKGKVMGTLFAATRGYRDFTDEDIQLLTSIGQQIGVAVENARLFGAERRRAEQFRLIGEVGRHITSILTVDELLQQMIKLIQDTLGYDRVSIGLVEGDEVVFKAAIGPGWDPPWDQHMRLQAGKEGVTAWVASTGKPLLVSDVSQEPRFIPSPVMPLSRSELAVPLKTKESTIGVLNAESFQLNAFDESDMAVLQSLADQAAVAIENARLYEQAQQLAVVEERQRLARELHDSVTQALYGMTLYSEAAAGQLSLGHVDRVAEHLRELQDTAQEALTEMRLLIYELRSPMLEEEGLVAALQARLLTVERRIGLKTEFKVEGEAQLPPEIEEGLYRIAQEALNNALKHARARKITVSLHHTEQSVTLEVADDGIGFDPAPARKRGGLGLAAMEERATDLGGRLSVKSRPQEGTRVLVEVFL